MNSSYGKSNNKTSPIDAFDFDLGLGSGRATPLNGQKSQTPSYTQQKPSTASSWTHQPNKPAWTHQPAPPIQSSGSGSLLGPTSMVGDIFGKSWNSSVPSSSGVSGIGIVNSKNPNLFSDLLGSAIGPNKSNTNVPLKSSAPVASPKTFQMGSMANSLPKPDNSVNNGKGWGSNVSNVSGNYTRSTSLGGGGGGGTGGAGVNLMGNSSTTPNRGGPSMKSMSGSGIGSGGMSSNKDSFRSFVDFSSKPSGGMNSTSKPSAKSDSGTSSFGNAQKAPSKTSVNDPLGDFGFSTNFSDNKSQPPKPSNDFDALFPSTDGFMDTRASEGGDDWGMYTESGGGNETTVELEGLPPPPAGVSASAAKSKGMDNYKQGQFADAIKWLSWAVVLLEKAGDGNGTKEVLTSRASCYKEVGEYKKAVADCTKVLEQDGKNVAVLVQRALLYESMEKYKLGAEDLRTVMNIDPGNRVAGSTIHRLIKMAG